MPQTSHPRIGLGFGRERLPSDSQDSGTQTTLKRHILRTFSTGCEATLRTRWNSDSDACSLQQHKQRGILKIELGNKVLATGVLWAAAARSFARPLPSLLGIKHTARCILSDARYGDPFRSKLMNGNTLRQANLVHVKHLISEVEHLAPGMLCAGRLRKFE